MQKKQFLIAFLISLHLSLVSMQLPLNFIDEFKSNTEHTILDLHSSFPDPIQDQYKTIKRQIFIALKNNPEDTLQETLKEHLETLDELVHKKSQQSFFQHDLECDTEYILIQALQKFIKHKIHSSFDPQTSIQKLIGTSLLKNETLYNALIRTSNFEILKKICSTDNKEKKSQENTTHKWRNCLSGEKIYRELLVKDLQFLKTDINEPDSNGDTPLHYACMQKSEKAARILIEAGANMYLTNKNGLNPYHVAIYNNKPKIVKYLSNLPYFNITQPCTDGQSPLYLAVCKSSAGMVDALLATNKFDVNMQIDGQTLLHKAVSRGDLGIVKSLLKTSSIDKNYCDKTQRTALDVALQEHKKNYELIATLIAHGVICKAPLKKEAVKSITEISQSKSFMQTIGQKEQAYIRKLLNQYSQQKKKNKEKKKSQKNPKSSRKPSKISTAQTKQKSSAPKKQNIQSNKKKFYELSGLINAYAEAHAEGLQCSKYEIAEKLKYDYLKSTTLEKLKSLLQYDVYKSQINETDGKGRLLIERATMLNFIELVDCLIEAGADVTILKQDCLPFLATLHHDNTAILKKLISAGDLTEENIFIDFQLLHYACKNNAYGCVEMLIKEYTGNKYIYCKNHHDQIPAHLTSSNEIISFLNKSFNEIVACIKEGHLEEIKNKLKSDDPSYKECLNHAGQYGDYIIEHAISRQNEKIIKCLLDHGAQITHLNTLHKKNILFRALNLKNIKILKLLLDASAFDAETVFVALQLFHPAVYRNNMVGTKFLLSKYGNEYINCEDTDGMIPFDIAQSDEMRNFLQENGARPREIKKEPTLPLNNVRLATAFFTSCRMGNVEHVKMLLERGLVDVAWRNPQGLTALHIAAEEGDGELTKLLLSYGADKDASIKKKNGTNYTPRKAALKRLPSNVIFLNEKSQNKITRYLEFFRYFFGPLNILYRNLENKIHFFNALAEGTTYVIEAILNDQNFENEVIFTWENKGPDVEAESVLHTAAGYGQNEIVKLLIEHEFPMNKLDAKGRNALCEMKYNIKNHELLLLLLNAGVNPGQRDKKGRTVFWEILKAELGEDLELHACEIIQTLIKWGVSINTKDIHGETILHWMIRKGYDHDNIFLTFISSQADLLLENNDKKTVIALIAKNSDRIPKIARKLERLYDLANSFARTVSEQNAQ